MLLFNEKINEFDWIYLIIDLKLYKLFNRNKLFFQQLIRWTSCATKFRYPYATLGICKTEEDWKKIKRKIKIKYKNLLFSNIVPFIS